MQSGKRERILNETEEEFRERVWVYPAIPEFRIRDEAIDAVSKDTEIPKDWVQRIHDFQWELIFNSISDNQTVYVPKIGRFLMKLHDIMGSVSKIQNKIDKSNETITRKEQRQLIETNSTRKKSTTHEIKKLRERIIELQEKIDDLMILANTKTQRAYSMKIKKKQ